MTEELIFTWRSLVGLLAIASVVMGLIFAAAPVFWLLHQWFLYWR